MTVNDEKIDKLERALKMAFQKQGEQELPADWRSQVMEVVSGKSGAENNVPQPPSPADPGIESAFFRFSLAMALVAFFTVLYYHFQLVEIEDLLVRFFF